TRAASRRLADRRDAERRGARRHGLGVLARPHPPRPPPPRRPRPARPRAWLRGGGGPGDPSLPAGEPFRGRLAARRRAERALFRGAGPAVDFAEGVITRFRNGRTAARRRSRCPPAAGAARDGE